MYKRVLEIENMLDEGNFLLGARQTGKSTLLQERFPDAICYDLLKSDLRKRFTGLWSTGAYSSSSVPQVRAKDEKTDTS